MKIFWVLSFAFFCSAAQAQIDPPVILKVSEDPIMVGYPIGIVIANPGKPCELVLLTTDNGSVRSISGCFYEWRPENAGKGVLKAAVIRKGDTTNLEERRFEVQTVQYVVRLAGRLQGELSKEKLPVLIRPTVHLQTSSHYYGVESRLEEYSVLVIRNDQVLFYMHNKGEHFVPELLSKLLTLERSDQLVLCNLQCITPAGKRVRLEPAEFIIVD